MAGESDKRPYRAHPLPFLLDDVRLVVALTNEDTGSVQDVVVNHVHAGEPILERDYGSSTPKHTRYVSGLNIEIPWPEPEMREFTDEAADTLRIEVEDKTWIPHLQSYPMPPTVIDELRNKYSSLRTRHEPEYVEKKKKEDAYQAWVKSRKLLSPKAELIARQAEEKQRQRELKTDEEGNLEVPEDTANFIQQYLEKKKASASAANS